MTVRPAPETDADLRQRTDLTVSRSTVTKPRDRSEEETRLLLRFAAPRDPELIAKWISYQVFNTERQDWRRGLEAAFRYREREQHLQVPYDHAEGAYPLGRWLSDQRRAFRAGEMSGKRAAELEDLPTRRRQLQALAELGVDLAR
ncbi:helicase associated domain-containing protein [Streptomyces sp. NBC_00320]|uniref:helicase associated domain-containing protein n=1 Tax=Streptomyces sp. NBC_00320 TaxID=2975711 RepID=UPI00225BA407|nr:helicase associated domain-containing protein [Streptomyces sp. NBC_00320]MCX5152207.1 helicase associated domain-containing protein [Streptomyces sp. NBC_00320]